MGRVLNPIVSESYMKKYIEEHGGDSKKVVYIPEQTVVGVPDDDGVQINYIATLQNANIDINNPPTIIPLTFDDTTYLLDYAEFMGTITYASSSLEAPLLEYFNGNWVLILRDGNSHTVSSVIEPNGTRKLSVHFVNSSETLVYDVNIRPTYDVLLSPMVYIGTLDIDAGESADFNFLYEVFEIDGTTYYGNVCPWNSVVTGTDDLVNCTYTNGKIYITDITKDASLTMHLQGGGR